MNAMATAHDILARVANALTLAAIIATVLIFGGNFVFMSFPAMYVGIYLSMEYAATFASMTGLPLAACEFILVALGWGGLTAPSLYIVPK